jgi:hypothetical protein
MPVGEGMELVTNCLSDEKKCTSSFRGVDNPTALLFRWRFVLRKWNIAVSAVYVFPQELNLKGAYSHQNAPGRSKCLHQDYRFFYALIWAGVFVGARLVPIEPALPEAWVWALPKSTLGIPTC